MAWPSTRTFSIILPSAACPASGEERKKKSHALTASSNDKMDITTDTASDAGDAPSLGQAGEGETPRDEKEEEEEEETKERHVRDLVRLKRKRRAARVSGPAWEAGTKGAADWNATLLRDRHLRGPWYWDPHSHSAQARSIPSPHSARPALHRCGLFRAQWDRWHERRRRSAFMCDNARSGDVRA